MILKKKINPAAIIALKEALTVIYWYKKDLKSFLLNTLDNCQILSYVNWDDFKRKIANSLVDLLIRNELENDLLKLFESVSSIKDFSHLEYLEDGKEKAEHAKRAVLALREYTHDHLTIIEEKQNLEEKRKEYIDQIHQVNAFKNELSLLHNEFCKLATSTNVQERGYDLESIIKKLFVLFDLDPKASFKIEGEQIDGAFTFDGIDYLFEAKWHNDPVRANDLDALASKVQRKLDNTLGLFLSINGFSIDGIAAHTSGRRVLLLMDGSDVIAVLEERIELPDLLRRKRRYAAQTGEIFLRFKDIV